MAAAASRGLSAAGEAAQLRDAVVAPKLSVATIKPRVVAADYAVRGEIVRRAQLLEDELQAGKRKFPFEKVSWVVTAAVALASVHSTRSSSSISTHSCTCWFSCFVAFSNNRNVEGLHDTAQSGPSTGLVTHLFT
jgi:hypothetical protein